MEIEEEENDIFPARSAAVLPYQFEPDKREEDRTKKATAAPLSSRKNRIHTTSWCQCGLCSPMETAEESQCCQEAEVIVQKLDKLEDLGFTSRPACITDHPGFASVCLDRFCLETAYFAYRQQYGHMDESTDRRYRYTGYRQFVRWCWGCLGKSVRVPLPSCVVTKIRNVYPDGGRVGFKLPPLK